ncbi:MAG: TonB-dependent receptor [Endomicrobium sp.]|jgi:hemoglobin/transferrin/lactoferrin receptor protein|nr:TonB-dependent receptor [Endomicrobium sp.]
MYLRKAAACFIAVLLSVNLYAQDLVNTADSAGAEQATQDVSQEETTTAQVKDNAPQPNDDSVNDAGVKKTQEITVTATKTQRTLREIPMTVNVITAQDIEKNPASSVSELLERLPGITLEDNGAAGLLKVRIRGESSARTLIIIDGVRQNDHAPTTGGLPILISPSDIERIEVIKGPSSVLYGSDALGGVVKIITKKGAGKPFSLTQRAVYDSSSERYDYTVGVSGRQDGFYYSGTFNSIYSGLRNTPEGELAGSNYEGKDYTAKLGYEWEKGEVSVGAQHHDRDAVSRQGTGNPPAVVDMDFVRTSYDADLVLKDITDNFVRFAFNAGSQKLERTTTDFFRITDTYTFMPQADLVFGDHYIIAGGEYDNDDFSSQQRSNMLKTEASLWTASLYVQDEWRAIEELAITAGVRQSWYHSSSGANSADTDRLVGSLGAVYLFNDNISFKANFSQGFKVPAIYYTAMGSSSIIPNPDLKPEESNNFEVGTILSVKNFNVEASLFMSEAKNFIAMSILSMSPTRVQYRNVNKAETFGAELGVSYDVAQFTPYANLTYIDRTYYNSPTSAVKKTNKTGSSPFYGSAGVRWEDKLFGFTLFSDLNLLWASQADNETSAGVITTEDGWTTLNLQVGIKKERYFFSLDIKNIADAKYIKTDSSPDFYEAGTYVILNAGFNF